MLKTFQKALVGGLLLAPMSAMAVPITVDFTVTADAAYYSDGTSLGSYNGFPVGTVGTGYFTIDDSIGNYSSVEVGITPIDFSFEWAGVTFT